MDRFEEMRTFVRVVDTGSFIEAARCMNAARSAVSRRVADLEARLGVQLLKRTTRRVSLTEAGQLFYQRCQRILADLEDSERAVASEHREIQGLIRIATPLSFGLRHLSPVLDEFLSQHPALRVDLNLNDSMINLMAEDIDLGIRIGKLQDSSMMARRLASINLLVCASPAYLAEFGEPQTPEALAQHQGLDYSNVPEGQLWQFKDSSGKTSAVKLSYRMRANNGDVLLKAAIDGLGVLVTPSFIAHEAIRSRQLKPILCDYSIGSSNIYAIYPAQRHLPHRVRALIDFLAQRFASNPYWNNLGLDQVDSI